MRAEIGRAAGGSGEQPSSEQHRKKFAALEGLASPPRGPVPPNFLAGSKPPWFCRVAKSLIRG